MRVRADFNGLFGELLCLSHTETCVDESGTRVELRSGMSIIAFDEDTNEGGERDDLVAEGTVEPAPDWLSCKGSRWVLRIDARGVHNASELERSDEKK